MATDLFFGLTEFLEGYSAGKNVVKRMCENRSRGICWLFV